MVESAGMKVEKIGRNSRNLSKKMRHWKEFVEKMKKREGIGKIGVNSLEN